MADSDKTHLPGIGTRHDFRLESGERMGVITHRDSGIRELVLFDPDDPDSCLATVRLTEADVQQVIGLLEQREPPTRG